MPLAYQTYEIRAPALTFELGADKRPSPAAVYQLLLLNYNAASPLYIAYTSEQQPIM